MSEIQKHPETLLVTRDGFIDDEYYDAIYAEKRREALRTAGREAVLDALHVTATIGKGIGHLLTHDLQHG